MPRDDGGGGIVGTPMDVLRSLPNSKKPFPSGRHWRPSPSDRLAPPAAQYAWNREQTALNSERDALRDIYRPADEIGAPAAPVGRTVDDIMDEEDRAHARRRPRKDGAGQVWNDTPAIVPVRTRVSVGHSILRAQGVLTNFDGAQGDRVAGAVGRAGSAEGLAAERRQKYRLGDLYAAVGQQGGRGRAGVGADESLRPIADRAERAASRDVRSFGKGESASMAEEGGDEERNGIVADGEDGDDDDVYGDARDGSLHAAMSRVKEAMQRKKRSPSLVESEATTADFDKVLSQLFVEDTSSTVDGELRGGANAHGLRLNSSDAGPDYRVPPSFARNPVHDWANDPFKGSGTLPEEPGLADYVDQVRAAERERVSVVGAKDATRRHAAAQKRKEKLLHVQATAGARLQSSFVHAGRSSGDERPTSTEMPTDGGPSHPAVRKRVVGDVSRKVYGWEPAPIVCKRLKIDRPVVHIFAREVEEHSLDAAYRRNRWKQETGLLGLDGTEPIRVSSGDEVPNTSLAKERQLRTEARPETAGGYGTIRVTSIVSRDGQVAVVEDGTGIDGERLFVLGDGSEDESEGGEKDEPIAGKEGRAHMGSPKVEDARSSEGDGCLQARETVRRAVFGSTGGGDASDSVLAPKAGVPPREDKSEQDVETDFVRPRQWRAVDFF